MKNILKIFLILGIIVNFFGIGQSFGSIVEFPDDVTDQFSEESISITSSTNVVSDIEGLGLDILSVIKLVFEGVMIIYIVYAGAQMILSMGSDEEELSNSKKSLWYAMIAFVFINIPGDLYDSFVRDNNYGNIDGKTTSTWDSSTVIDDNVLVDMSDFSIILNGKIMGFIEVIISTIAIIFIIISGIKIIKSRGKDEDFQKAKTKITWSLVGLIFVGFIEAWKSVLFTGDYDDGMELFNNIANLALYFAGPIAIFFLTLAAYYYINSNGDDERIKKAKNIVVNTVIATVLLLASYTFLSDLQTLSF